MSRAEDLRYSLRGSSWAESLSGGAEGIPLSIRLRLPGSSPAYRVSEDILNASPP